MYLLIEEYPFLANVPRYKRIYSLDIDCSKQLYLEFKGLRLLLFEKISYYFLPFYLKIFLYILTFLRITRLMVHGKKDKLDSILLRSIFWVFNIYSFNFTFFKKKIHVVSVLYSFSFMTFLINLSMTFFFIFVIYFFNKPLKKTFSTIF